MSSEESCNRLLYAMSHQMGSGSSYEICYSYPEVSHLSVPVTLLVSSSCKALAASSTLWMTSDCSWGAYLALESQSDGSTQFGGFSRRSLTR